MHVDSYPSTGTSILSNWGKLHIRITISVRSEGPRPAQIDYGMLVVPGSAVHVPFKNNENNAAPMEAENRRYMGVNLPSVKEVGRTCGG